MKYGFAQMRIVTFCNKEDNEKYHNKQKVISYEISPQIYTRTCLIDNKNKIAYNIYTPEESFPVLDTNEEGFILPNNKIEMGKRYAIKEEEKSKKELISRQPGISLPLYLPTYLDKRYSGIR